MKETFLDGQYWCVNFLDELLHSYNWPDEAEDVIKALEDAIAKKKLSDERDAWENS